jgi:hypothetical protein
VWNTALMYLDRGITNSDGLALQKEYMSDENLKQELKKTCKHVCHLGL